MHLPQPFKKGLYGDEDVNEATSHRSHVCDSICRGFTSCSLILAHYPYSGPSVKKIVVKGSHGDPPPLEDKVSHLCEAVETDGRHCHQLKAKVVSDIYYFFFEFEGPVHHKPWSPGDVLLGCSEVDVVVGESQVW